MQRRSEHEAPLSAGVGHYPNQSQYVTPNALREALAAVGVTLAPGRGEGLAQCVLP